MKRKGLVLTALAAVWIMNCSGASASGQSLFSADPDTVSCRMPEAVMLPDGMVHGTLDNGLGYYIMENGSPSRMIEFRLIFRTGSVMEDDGNRGAAHFLEHMAFGGTRHFPKRKLVDYLESLGVQYGIGINAFTGYDRTIYMFSMPSDEPENLDKALLIIKDWLTAITLNPGKVRKEKGVIKEELRGYDVGDEFYDLKIGIGPYSEGIPLGTEEDIERITPEILKDFHDTWYTLDRATVAVVGDVDVADMERRIVGMLGTLEPTESPVFDETPLEYAPGITVKSVGDTLARSMNFELIVPHAAVMKRTLGESIVSGRNRMLVRGITSRLHETGNRATVSNSWYFADKEHFVVSLSGDGKADAMSSFRSVMAEIHRLADEGFTDGEMQELREEANVYVPSGMNSYLICENIADAVLFGDVDVSDPSQAAFVLDGLRNTSSEDLRKILESWLGDASACSLVACTFNPQTMEEVVAEDVASAMKEASVMELAPFVYEAEEPEAEVAAEIPDMLVEERPFDGSMISRFVCYDNIGVTDVLLKNGLRFVLRPTPDGEGRVQLQTFAPGGLSVVPEDDYAYYEGLAGYMELGGIEGLDEGAYHSVLAENGIGLILGIESYWHGMIASAPVEHSRLLFNIMYERMVHPELDYEEFEEIRQDELRSFGDESYLSKLMKLDVQRQLAMQIDSLMGNYMYGRRTEITKEDLQRLDLDTLATVYRKLFSNPDGMTFVVCGEFDVDSLLMEAVPVFSRMRKGEAPNRMGPSHYRLPEVTVKKEFPNANETQTLFDYIRFGQYDPSLRSGLKLKLMNNLIRNRLLTVLREQESLVYSPYTALFYTAEPDRVFYIDINASVDRNNTARVHEVLDEIIEDLQRKKVSERELNTLKQIFIVNKRTYLEEDATANWKSYLVKQLRNAETLVELDMYESVLESITPEELREEFRQCFDTGRYMILSIGKYEAN